jgi:hypothetical protein
LFLASIHMESFWVNVLQRDRPFCCINLIIYPTFALKDCHDIMHNDTTSKVSFILSYEVRTFQTRTIELLSIFASCLFVPSKCFHAELAYFNCFWQQVLDITTATPNFHAKALGFFLMPHDH